MAIIYDLDGKKKVIFQEKPEIDITYKEIMRIVIANASEEVCHQIFCNGGVNMCPSDVFGDVIIDKQKEEDACNYKSIGCTKCWTRAINKIKKEIERKC